MGVVVGDAAASSRQQQGDTGPRVPALILVRYREEEVHKRNNKLGTQDPIPSHEGMSRLSFWRSNMWTEDDDRKSDLQPEHRGKQFVQHQPAGSTMINTLNSH